MRLIINFVNPDGEMLPLVESFNETLSPYRFLKSEMPLPYADLLFFPLSDLTNFKDRPELEYIPFILYGRSELISRAFLLGADDYMKPPYGLEEIETRSARILKKNRLIIKGREVFFFHTHLESENNRIRLSDREFQIISLLAANRGNVVSREGILYRLQLGSDPSRSLDVLINSLRNKISAVTENSESGNFVICTVRRKGYTINSQVTCG